VLIKIISMEPYQHKPSQ